MTSIRSDLMPEPSPPTCIGNTISKIPLPKCLVELPVGITARSRTELRDINLAGDGCKWDQENNCVNRPLYSNSEPSTLFTTLAKVFRGHGDRATLTPISVNTFSAIIDGAGSNATTQHESPASQQSPFGSGSSSSRFVDGEKLSSEELPRLICERGKHVESMRLSTSGMLAGDSTFIKISSNGSAYLENNADHSAKNSCHSSELLRTSSILMELEDAPLGLSDTESADQRSTKKDLFDASLLAEEDSDLVTFDKTMTTSLFTHGELHSTFEDENLFIVHNCCEDHQRQAACFPLHAMEEQLEDDIQRGIEDEISKEIQHLSQKLASLQARHGAQRMSDGSMPSVLSCPVTPVLTPRISRLRKEVTNHVGNSKPGVDHGGRHKRGRLVAARVSSGREKPAHQLSIGPVRKESSLERRCSSSNSLNARCGPSGQQEEHYGEDSPSPGSIRSHATDSTHNKKPRARKLQAGVASPQVFPDNNRRFEWVKTLRSGETDYIRHSKQLPSISGEELESRRSLESVKKKRVALLADMTRELESRLNDLAVGSAAHPARNVGRVVASRYNQPRREKSQPEDYYGSLQKRTAAHLMKAGLTRGLAGKKSQESCSKSKPDKKAGDKVPEKKSVGIQHNPSHDQPSHDILEQAFETANEAFVEGPSDVPKILSEALEVKEEQADQGKMAKISPGISSEEQSSAVVRPRLSKRQPIKRTYIRCIEVVNDPSLAARSASDAIESLSTSRIIPESTEGQACLVNAGATSNSNPHVTDTSQSSVISLHDKVVGSKSVKPRDQPLRSTDFKLHGTSCQELGCVQADMFPGSSDLKAEKPPLSTLRERWDELIDGLEKERLTLPRIRTETGSVVTSPRDSGGVKRITEQRLRSKEQHFNPEDLQEEEKQVSVDVFNSRKETSQKSKPTRRQLRRNHEEFNTPQSDLEGFDLESFWCLIRESEDNVPTTTTTAHPPIAAVR